MDKYRVLGLISVVIILLFHEPYCVEAISNDIYISLTELIALVEESDETLESLLEYAIEADHESISTLECALMEANLELNAHLKAAEDLIVDTVSEKTFRAIANETILPIQTNIAVLSTSLTEARAAVDILEIIVDDIAIVREELHMNGDGQIEDDLALGIILISVYSLYIDNKVVDKSQFREDVRRIIKFYVAGLKHNPRMFNSLFNYFRTCVKDKAIAGAWATFTGVVLYLIYRQFKFDGEFTWAHWRGKMDIYLEELIDPNNKSMGELVSKMRIADEELNKSKGNLYERRYDLVMIVFRGSSYMKPTRTAVFMERYKKVDKFVRKGAWGLVKIIKIFRWIRK